MKRNNTGESPSLPLSNHRHEQFACGVAAGMKPAEAYVAAGFSPKGAPQAACRLLKVVKVRSRLEQLRTAIHQSTVARAVVNREFVIDSLRELLLMCMGKMNVKTSKGETRVFEPSAANRAAELLGRELGLFVDRSMNVPWDGDLSKLDSTQLDNLLASLERKIPPERQAELRALAERKFKELTAPAEPEKVQ